MDSVIMADNLATIHDSEIDRVIGPSCDWASWTQLSAQLWPCSREQIEPPTPGWHARNGSESTIADFTAKWIPRWATMVVEVRPCQAIQEFTSAPLIVRSADQRSDHYGANLRHSRPGWESGVGGREKRCNFRRSGRNLRPASGWGDGGAQGLR